MKFWRYFIIFLSEPIFRLSERIIVPPKGMGNWNSFHCRGASQILGTTIRWISIFNRELLIWSRVNWNFSRASREVPKFGYIQLDNYRQAVARRRRRIITDQLTWDDVRREKNWDFEAKKVQKSVQKDGPVFGPPNRCPVTLKPFRIGQVYSGEGSPHPQSRFSRPSWIGNPFWCELSMDVSRLVGYPGLGSRSDTVAYGHCVSLL